MKKTIVFGAITFFVLLILGFSTWFVMEKALFGDQKNTVILASPDSGSQDSPVPIGQRKSIDENWSIQVNNFDPDPQVVQERDDFLSEIDNGAKLAAVNITVEYTGDKPSKMDFIYDMTERVDSTHASLAERYPLTDESFNRFKEFSKGDIETGNLYYIIPSGPESSKFDLPEGSKQPELIFSAMGVGKTGGSSIGILDYLKGATYFSLNSASVQSGSSSGS